MTDLLTAAQMRAIERDAIDSGAVSGRTLMERAGRGVVEAVFAAWPALAEAPQRAVVLCGPGNNGGDGFVIARLLRDRGWDVAVLHLGAARTLPPDARANYARWTAMGAVAALEPQVLGMALDGPALVVDAVFGTGLTRPFDLLPQMDAALAAAHPRPHVVAVDLPSGLCSDSGIYLGDFQPRYAADLTVSFHAEKLGHRLGMGPVACGRIVIKSIGLKCSPSPEVVQLVDRGTVAGMALAKEAGHKYAHGHAYVVSGPTGHTGAARLAARGALRIGAGLVTVACPPDAVPEHAAQLNAVMIRPVDDARGLAAALAERRINALCLGPGLGVNDGTKDLVLTALNSKRATILDADALTVFADDSQALFDALHPDCVLTPHGGEFARLFPDIAEKRIARPAKGPAYSKVNATREAAARAGCVVLFKGPDTVIAAPDGRCAVQSAAYDRAAPWLATAGSGDVLAGFITALLARGFGPAQAAQAAAWLHVECALRFGAGLIAEDLPEQLPAVFRDLGL